MLLALRLLAIAGAVLGAATFLVFSSGFHGGEGLFVFWTISPLPVAYGIFRLAARTPLAMKIAIAGLSLSLALASWAYGHGIHGHLSRTESLAGLIVLLAPAIQYAVLAPFVLAAGAASWLAARRNQTA